LRSSDPCPYLLLWGRGLSAINICRLCLLKVHAQFGYLPLLPSRCAQSTTPSLLHVLFSSLFINQLFFCVCVGGRPSVCPGGASVCLLVYPRGSYGNTTCRLFVHLLVCVSQAGLEPVSSSVGALLFSQCNMAWRSFVRAGVQGVGVLILLGGFFLPSVAPASQQNF
jgi:hypothetical protein